MDGDGRPGFGQCAPLQQHYAGLSLKVLKQSVNSC